MTDLGDGWFKLGIKTKKISKQTQSRSPNYYISDFYRAWWKSEFTVMVPSELILWTISIVVLGPRIGC